jgi:deoxyribodipyrimidine photo-lyase
MTRLVLFNQAQRLTDNALLTQQGDNIAVLLIDSRQYLSSQYGVIRASQQRLALTLALAENFRIQMQQQGVALLCIFADPTEFLPQIISQFAVTTMVMAEPVAFEEQQLQQLAAQFVPVQTVDLNSLLAGELRPVLTTLPNSFTQFRLQREPELAVSNAVAQTISGRWLQAPAELYAGQWQQQLILFQAAPSDQALHTFILPDEQSEQQKFAHYLFGSKAILHYKNSRNQFCDLPATETSAGANQYASLVSAGLSHGTLSVRWLWQQICQFEQQFGTNEHSYWLRFELLWREYFRWQMRKFGVLLFRQQGLGKHPVPKPQGSPDKQQLKFKLWCDGNTGMPLVDANMRLLTSTGLMSNRGRQLVASYLIYDLTLDWRWGAAFFEQQLHDFDVASNWGNWAYIAGAGTAPGRYFNQLKQALIYDTDAYFIRRQLPHLAHLGKAAHLPYLPDIAAEYQQATSLPPLRDDWQNNIRQLQQVGQDDLLVITPDSTPAP